MAQKDWTTNYPTQLDTDTEQPNLVNNEDVTRVSHVMSLRDAVQEIQSIIGSNNLESGSIKQKLSDGAITEDTIYYVDGDSGSDSNDGLSWVNAKKTFDFLYSGGTGSIPRELKADVTINVRGTVLSVGSDRHLLIDKFYGSGKISIIGEAQDVVTGLSPTSWDNTNTSVDYHQHIEVSGESWTADEYQGMFIQFTNPSSDVFYPVTNNSSTRLETMDLPDLDGTETFKIVSLSSKLKAATVSAPSTLITYGNYFLDYVAIEDSEIYVSFEKVDFQSLGNGNYLSSRGVNSVLKTDLNYFDDFSCHIKQCVIPNFWNFSGSALLEQVFGNMNSFAGISALSPITITKSCFNSNDGNGNGLSAVGNNFELTVTKTRITNNRWGLFSSDAGVLRVGEHCVFENLPNGIYVDVHGRVMAINDYYGPLTFKDNDTCIDLGGGKLYVQYDIKIARSGNTNEIRYENNPNAYFSFSDVESNTPLSNSKYGSYIIYRDSSGDPIIGPEYDNSTSGLDAYNYQDAIDAIGSSVSFFNEGFEPNGFINMSDSSISFNDGLLRFSVTPTGDSFSYYAEGSKYTKSTAQTVDITDTEGNWYFYFNGDTLVASQSFSDDVIAKYGYVASIYWDATNSKHILLGDERHGFIMDGTTHAYLHETRGTQHVSGLGLSGFSADGDGSDNAHAQLGYASGIIRDEDIEFNHGAASAPASISVFYKTGASGIWRRQDATAFPVIRFGTGRLAWNEFTGGAWQQTQVTEGDLMLMHYFATNDPIQPVIGVQGQAVYTDVPAARAGAGTEISALSLGGLPFVEFTALGTVIFQTSNSYSNTVKARVRTTDLGDDYVDFRQALFNSAGSASNHSNLSNLGNDDHTHYSLVDGTRAFTGVVSGVTPTSNAHLATKLYVDGVAGAAGSDGQIQYNNGGSALGGASGLYWDDVNSRLGIGTTSPSSSLTLVGTDGSSSFRSIRYSTDAGQAGLLARKARGTEGAPATVINTDYISRIIAQGHDGTDWRSAGFIDLFVDGTPANNRVPGGFAVALATSTQDATERFRISSDGKLSTGGETAPDVDPGGLCLNHVDSDGRVLTFKNSDVSHPFSFAESDTYGSFGKSASVNGGISIMGLTAASSFAIHLDALASTASTGDTSIGVVNLNFAKNNAGSRTDLASSEVAVSFRNNSTVKAVIKGNGDFVTQGGLKAVGAYSDTVGVTNRDLFVDSTGLIGYVSSSLRYKENVVDMEDTSWLYSLRPVNFNYKETSVSDVQYGFIAEEVESVNSKFVSYDQNGQVETVQYSKLISVLVKEVQRLSAEVEALKY